MLLLIAENLIQRLKELCRLLGRKTDAARNLPVQKE